MIDAWFDFGSPLSMLARHLLYAEIGNRGTPIRWHPHEGGDGVRDSAWLAQVWDRSVRPLADRLGVRVSTAPPRPTSTRLALQGYQYALDQGRADAYGEQVFHAHFVERLDISEPQSLEAIARRAGLDPKLFSAAAASAHYAKRHLAAVSQWPVRVTPTVVCGGYRIEGVPTKAQLVKLAAASARSRAGAGADHPWAAAEHGAFLRFFELDELVLDKPVEQCGGT